jgi:hypothetical protein
MNALTAKLVTLAILACPLTWRSPAQAHDWYPTECCSQHDCTPAKAIHIDARGGTNVIVGDVRIAIPPGFVARSSPDGRVHVCFRTFGGDIDGNIVLMPICLFLPPQS